MADPPKPSVAHSSGRRSDFSDRYCRQSGSAPGEFRAGVKALVTARDRVLLLKERRSENSTFWTIPGGGVESGESLTESLHRELHEEIQCGAIVGELVGGCTYSHLTCPATSVYTVFDVTLLSEPDPNRDEGIIGHAWFRPDNLPPATLDPIQQFIRTTVDCETDGAPVPDRLMLSSQQP